MSTYANRNTLTPVKNPVVTIVTPVFNDWVSFFQLLRAIDRVAVELKLDVCVLAVDDGSTHIESFPSTLGLSDHMLLVEIIHLVRNLGHQRAIAIGLVEAESRNLGDTVIVMDADGEDSPDNFGALLDEHRQQPDAIIVAMRGRRSEGLVFRSFYVLYKLIFKLLVGQMIDFGNFCLIPRAHLMHLTHNSNLWNHLAAALGRSRLPLRKVKINRSARYAGRSHMNFESLVLHGLSAISVYLDRVLVRMLLFSSLSAVLGMIGVLIVIGIRLFTDLAIPGWATSAVGLLIILVFQLLIFSSGAAFFILSTRSGISIIPALDTLRLIHNREVIVNNESTEL